MVCVVVCGDIFFLRVRMYCVYKLSVLCVLDFVEYFALVCIFRGNSHEKLIWKILVNDINDSICFVFNFIRWKSSRMTMPISQPWIFIQTQSEPTHNSLQKHNRQIHCTYRKAPTNECICTPFDCWFFFYIFFASLKIANSFVLRNLTLSIYAIEPKPNGAQKNQVR